MTGSIKDYTPNFEFIIPEFNITGWHDYLEENFRSIDALFYNLFGINNFKGQWKNSTVYNVNDVVFVGEDTNYSGRLIKVLVQHTTAGTGNFTEFFTANPSYYELFADASSAQIFAQEAKDWAVKMDGPVEEDLYSAKFYANIVNSLSTEITTLYNIRSDIQNVSLIGTEVVIVSNIKNSVQTVANNTTNINTVANNLTNININATNISDINTNATNISAINTNASNISDIQNAYSNAQSALNSKNLAQEWATSENLVDNTDYSAKHYAEIAQTYGHPLYVGEIIQSTIPLSDAGLHLLDGSLIQGNGIYADFVTYIAGLVSTYPDLFETEANWQQSVTTYGVCGKFVYDNVNNTVRLPKITGFVEGTTSLTALGDLIQAGLPNIEGELYGMSKIFWGQTNATDYVTQTGALRRHDVNGVYTGGSESATRGNGFTFDASLSNSIYGNSSTVQPQAIKVLYYIVLATSAKTQIEVDIDEIAADLNTKADVDLSNVSIASSFSNALNTAGIRTVVESYQNGTDWYRIWSDGWVEQGGFTSASATPSGYITLLVEMRDTNYFCRAYYQANDTGGSRTNYGYCEAYSTTQILVGSYSTSFKNSWEVKGFKK